MRIALLRKQRDGANTVMVDELQVFFVERTERYVVVDRARVDATRVL